MTKNPRRNVPMSRVHSLSLTSASVVVSFAIGVLLSRQFSITTRAEICQAVEIRRKFFLSDRTLRYLIQGGVFPMNRWIARLGASFTLVSLTAGIALAGPPKDKDNGAKAMTCPVCHMALSTKKTKDNPTAIKIKGKTYYCCAK